MKAALIGSSITFLICLLLHTYIVNTADGGVIKEWHQPEDLIYGKSKYRVYLLQNIPRTDLFAIEQQTDHRLVVAKVGTKPELSFAFGHSKRYGLSESSFIRGKLQREETTAYVERCSVEWNESGITFIEPSGHRLFIPADAFIDRKVD